MKFNVHYWNGTKWMFVTAVEAVNEQAAAMVVSKSYGLKGKFASYPHIDTIDQYVSGNSVFTEII